MEIPHICRYCGGIVRLVPAESVYGDSAVRLGLKGEKLYQCQNCNARVGCHRGTVRPLGDLANEVLRLKRLVGVGKITVLAAAHSHVRHLGVILRRRLQQRLAALAGHKFLATFHLPAGQPVYRLFNARRHHVLGCHHRNKSGVAHHVPYMGADIAQHGQIPPCVPFVLEAGGHLLADIPVDVCQHRVPLRLIGGFHELLRQRLVDLQLRGLVVAVFLVQLCLQVRNAALCLIKLRLRRQLLQNPGGLQSLCRAPLVLHHVGKHVQRRSSPRHLATRSVSTLFRFSSARRSFFSSRTSCSSSVADFS